MSLQLSTVLPTDCSTFGRRFAMHRFIRTSFTPKRSHFPSGASSSGISRVIQVWLMRYDRAPKGAETIAPIATAIPGNCSSDSPRSRHILSSQGAAFIHPSIQGPGLMSRLGHSFLPLSFTQRSVAVATAIPGNCSSESPRSRHILSCQGAAFIHPSIQGPGLMSRLGHSFLPLSFTQRSVARDEGAIFVENEGRTFDFVLAR